MAKRRVGRPRKVGRKKGGCEQDGGKFLKDVGKFLKNTYNSAKRSKYISRAASALADEGVPYAATVARVSDKMGLGVGGRRGRRRGGAIVM